jgi:hypothetical protein
MWQRSITVKSLSFALIGVISTGLGSPFVGAASAKPVAPDACRTATAPSTFTPGMPYGQGAGSGDYLNIPGCNRFVVDIEIPNNYSDEKGPLISGFIQLSGRKVPGLTTDNYGFPIPTNKAKCSSFLAEASFYKKSQIESKFSSTKNTQEESNFTVTIAQEESEFALIKSIKLTGKWDGDRSSCTLTSKPSDVTYVYFTPPSSGFDVYRVAASLKVGNTYIPVTAGVFSCRLHVEKLKFSEENDHRCTSEQALTNMYQLGMKILESVNINL